MGGGPMREFRGPGDLMNTDVLPAVPARPTGNDTVRGTPRRRRATDRLRLPLLPAACPCRSSAVKGTWWQTPAGGRPMSEVLRFPHSEVMSDQLPAHIDPEAALTRLEQAIASETKPLYRQKAAGMTTLDPVFRAIGLLLLRRGAAISKDGGIMTDLVEREVTSAFAAPPYERPPVGVSSVALDELKRASRAKLRALREYRQAVRRWRKAVRGADEARHRKPDIAKVANTTPGRITQILRKGR